MPVIAAENPEPSPPATTEQPDDNDAPTTETATTEPGETNLDLHHLTRAWRGIGTLRPLTATTEHRPVA